MSTAAGSPVASRVKLTFPLFLAEFPVLRLGAQPPRNVYWVGGYPRLHALASRRVQTLLEAP